MAWRSPGWAGHFSRRAFLRRAGIGGAGLAAVFAAACGGDGDGERAESGSSAPAGGTPATGPTAAAEQIRPGGTMKVVWETEPQGTLDPHKTAGGFSLPMIVAVYEGFLYKPAGKPALALLAESWESPEPTTFTFKLRQGVTFQDGTPLTAAVAKWNMERITGPGFFYDGGYRGAAAGLTTIEASDERTVRAVFTTAKVDSLSVFYWNGLTALNAMVSREAATRLGDAIGRQPVGTGPFALKEWVSDNRMSYDKYPGYWGRDAAGRQLPYLDQLQFVSIPDPNVAVLSLQRNEVQAVMVSPQQALQLESDRNVELLRGSSTSNLVFWLNHNKPPFDDLNLRKAVAYAIKRDEVAKAAYFNQARPLGGGYHPDGDWHDPAFKGPGYDPQVVRQSLAAAGMPNGFSFECAVLPAGPRKTAGELIQAHLKEFGIEMRPLPMESNEYVQRGLNRGELVAILASAGSTGVDDTPVVQSNFVESSLAFVPPADRAKAGRDLIAKTRTQFDAKERYKTFQELAQWFWNDFIARIDVLNEPRIAAQRREFGGFDWFSTRGSGWWNGAYRRA
jgi:peptide/nickel transport system substrate-binding protein